MGLRNAFDYTNFMERKTFFRVQKLGWNGLGFWIGSDTVTQLRFWILIFNCFEVLIYGIFQLFYCYENLDNIKAVLDGLLPFVTQVPCVLRVLVLVWQRDNLKNVLDYLKNIFLNSKILSCMKNSGIL
jgi:hypothetical protein